MRRYIDADEVEKRIDIVMGSEPKAWDKKALKELKMYIVHAAPTADVRENVRGEWLHDEVTMNGNTVYTPNAKCSICDCYVFQESNFCPNCGADMRPITALSKNAEIDSNSKRGEV